MIDPRAQLASMLRSLELSDSAEVRVEAATLANRLALAHGDTSLADVAESLAMDPPPVCTLDEQGALELAAAVARATRRAIALARRNGLGSPRELAESLVSDPSQLVHDVRQNLADGRGGIAQAVLEIGLSRHPTSAELHALEGEVRLAR